jgi:hypothetical protein
MNIGMLVALALEDAQPASHTLVVAANAQATLPDQNSVHVNRRPWPYRRVRAQPLLLSSVPAVPG